MMKPKIFTLALLGIAVWMAACQRAPVSPSQVSGGDELSMHTPEPTLTTAPSPEPFRPEIRVLGEPEVVFEWDEARCENSHLVDLPARAIRTSDGQIQVFNSSVTNFRLIGPDFHSLKPDCSPVLRSDLDRDPKNYNHSEWLAAPYTLDGQTIYALVHQEFHGDQVGAIWQANRDFGPEQGGNNWTYMYWNGTQLTAMQHDDSVQQWKGSQPYCWIAQTWMHPGPDCQPNLSWRSPVSERIKLSGRLFDLDPGGGIGVIAYIFHGDTKIWSDSLENGDQEGKTFNLEVDVNKGDFLHFRLEQKKDSSHDATHFIPDIHYGPDPCPSGLHAFCTLISLTYAVSTDGGATFTQPEMPGHLVANFPNRYDPDWMRAVWQPSNIVQHPEDGYFYALIQLDEHALDGSRDIQGMCVMRTQSLEDPGSWRAWDGEAFSIAFTNPYLEPGLESNAQPCTLVSPEIGALTYGLTYNTFLEKFIAIGVGFDGFYFSWSEDLVHWSPRIFIMEAMQTFSPGAEPPFLPYPTLIDHDSPSLSFDVSDQTPYLYFTRMNGSASAVNTDLMRVQVELSK